jgi:hypothetical protein
MKTLEIRLNPQSINTIKIEEITKQTAIEMFGNNIPEIGFETKIYGKVTGYAMRSDFNMLFCLCEKKGIEQGGLNTNRVR